ncbi:MAG: hypothetical protein WC755_01540 [Candidatus Woesearchaeota archaeon]|jgi:hypothetical protein
MKKSLELLTLLGGLILTGCGLVETKEKVFDKKCVKNIVFENAVPANLSGYINDKKGIDFVADTVYALHDGLITGLSIVGNKSEDKWYSLFVNDRKTGYSSIYSFVKPLNSTSENSVGRKVKEGEPIAVVSDIPNRPFQTVHVSVYIGNNEVKLDECLKN